MPKKSATPTVYARGPILWMRFRNAKQQIRRPLSGELGEKLRVGSDQDAILKAIYRGWEQWKSEQERLIARQYYRSTISDLTAKYVEKRSPRWDILTIKQYENWITTMERFFGPNTLLEDLNLEAAEEFQSYLMFDLKPGNGFRKNLAYGTVNKRTDFAKQVFKWAVSHEMCTRNPFDGLEPLKSKPVRKKMPFTPEEIKKLLAAALEVCPHMHLCIVVLALTGIRRTCSRFLLVEHYDPKTNVLLIPEDIMKLDLPAKFHLSPGFSALLKRQIKGRAGHEPLLVNKNGRRLADWEYDVSTDKSKWDPRSSWRKVLEAADVPHRGVHQFRNGITTQIVSNAILEAIKVTQNTADVCKKYYAEVTGESQQCIMTKVEKDLGIDIYASLADNEPSF